MCYQRKQAYHIAVLAVMQVYYGTDTLGLGVEVLKC